jgi:hypothetical protein
MEVASMQEAIAVAEATHAVIVLAARTSAPEAAAAWDSATLRIEDAKDRAILTEGEALERVSRAESENSAVLASAHADAEGIAWKVVLLDGELVEEH